MRIWFKEWKDNHLIKDTVVEDFGEETRTHKVFMALEEACRELSLRQHPAMHIEINDYHPIDILKCELPS